MSTRSFSVHDFRHITLATLLLFAGAPACTDEGEPTGETTLGAGGAGASGGTAGAGGTGGAGGNGGAGGGAVTCLPESAYASLFTLQANDLCAVAVYTAATTIAYQQPSWGTHGGPLLVAAGPGDGDVTLSRWSPPSGAEGAMTVATTTIGAKIPGGAFAGAQALDLTFRPGTVISYAGSFPDTEGEVIVATESGTDERYPVNGFFSVAEIPASTDATTGRLVHTSLSPLGDPDAGANALHAADDCAGTFVPEGGSPCAEPLQIAAWGDASGPVVTDALGDVLVVMSNFAGDQEIRGFAASKIGKGGAAFAGDSLLTLDGFGLSLAALAPTGLATGVLAFQPADGMTFEALDVLQVRYTVENGALVTSSMPPALLALKTPNTPVALLTDTEDRLWAGVSILDDQGAPVSTTFVVIARKPD